MKSCKNKSKTIYIIFICSIFLLLLILFLLLNKSGNYEYFQNNIDIETNNVDDQVLFRSNKVIKYVKNKREKEIGEDTVYFYLEKITINNLNKWIKYVNDQKLQTERSGALDDRKGDYIPIIDGITSSLINLDLFNALRSNNENLYMAYTSRNKDFKSLNLEKDVEMSFGVFCSEQSPIVTHMGIFRNYKYFLMENEPHLNLSTELHAFVAKCEIMMKGVPKMYICTRPANVMRDIFIKMLSPIPNALYIGDNKERLELLELYNKTNLARSEINSISDLSIEKVQNILNTLVDKKTFSIDEEENIVENIKDKIKSNLDKIIRKRKLFIPSNIKELTPLNNFGEEWQIINPKTKDIILSFKKPTWFQHRDLNNHLDMTMIDIPIMSNFF
jgi:hypothetical protein